MDVEALINQQWWEVETTTNLKKKERVKLHAPAIPGNSEEIFSERWQGNIALPAVTQTGKRREE